MITQTPTAFSRILLQKLLFVGLALSFSTSWAHNPAVSLQEIKKWGFHAVASGEKVYKTDLQAEKIPYASGTLSLPLKKLLPSDPIGANMHQLQSYTKPDYFHSGVDIRAEIGQEIYAPVSGRIEAGYYSYADNPDGTNQKYFLPYAEAVARKTKPPWGDFYFEVAVIDQNGYRFEMHHVDSNQLPEEVKEKILKGGSVQEGELLGKVVRCREKLNGLPYHHLHYNVFSASGIPVNPFYLSLPIEDLAPPNILFVHSVQMGKCVDNLPMLNKIEMETEKYIVVEAKDFIQGRYLPNPPTILRAFFKDSTWEWNFTESLTDAEGLRPDIRDIYLQGYCDGNGIKSSGSNSDRFYIKIPVPEFYNGKVLIEAYDFAGNKTSREIEVRTPSI